MPPRAPACPLCCFLQPPACHRSPVGEPHILALPHLGHIRQWDDLRDSKQASGQAAQLQSNPAHVRDCRHFRSTAGRCNSFRAHRPGAQAACLDFLVAKQVAPAAGARRAGVGRAWGVAEPARWGWQQGGGSGRRQRQLGCLGSPGSLSTTGPASAPPPPRPTRTGSRGVLQTRTPAPAAACAS